MNVKQNSQRVVILSLVAIFFITSLGSAVYAIYDSVKNKDKKDSSSSQLADAQKKAQELQAQNSNQNTSTPKKEGALQGTKLANFTPVAKVDSLQIIDLVPGTGAEVQQGATVTADYTGALAKDGTIFQSSKDSGQPFTAALSGVIQGWQQGIPGMKVGGTRRLVIPANLAYGNQSPSADIPAGSDLVFDIELHDTK